ncbi:MAG TPA: HAMP domain-containing sensor histidine kinase [Campylobacterales bacterium]|nr:HAMP domain-containing sensor histidine kinase [Campylobacterales bacterium]
MLQSFKEIVVEKLLEAAKVMPFGYFVAGGAAFAVLFAFGLYALEVYLFFGSGLSTPMVVIGIITPLITASICFYFTAIIIKRLIKAENSISTINAKLQEQIEEEVQKRRHSERLMSEQSKMAMMGEMMGAIAHQWRQPLNALGIMVQEVGYVREDELNQEYIERFIGKSMLQINYMSKTIDEFRSFFSPDRAKKEFCVQKPIKEALHIIEASLENAGIKIVYEQGGCDLAYGYEGEFGQVILNLLSNSKYAILHSKTQKKQITISISQTNDTTKIAIKDSGGGINAKIIDRIFEPYFTTKPQGEGTGIGLYMSKQIIERHIGGSLVAQNGDFGAIFTITLPKLTKTP